MNELETNIVEIADDDLEKLFKETPASTVNAENLLGVKKNQGSEEDEEEENDDDDSGKKKRAVTKTKTTKAQDRLEDIDLDDLDKSEEDEDEEDEEEDDDKTSKKSLKKSKSVNDGEEDDNEEEEEEESSKKSSKKAQSETEEASDVQDVLKNTVDYLINSGIWQDFEGREELEINEETYAKLVAKQDEHRVTSMFNELVDSTGPFGKAIIDFVKSGGNPDEIIDLFKEQKQVESISIDSVDGQKELIKHYYTEVMGWKPEKADKYISQLILSNELEDESIEVKELFSNFYKKETERLAQEQKDFTDRQKEAEQAFESNIKTEIKSRKDLSSNEKKLVEDYLLNYDQRLPNGKMVNKFYVNFGKLQANPKDYVDFVMFVMDKEKFLAKVAVTEKTKAAAGAFKFIKGAGAISKTKGTSHEQIKRNEKVTSFDWGLPKKQ